MLKYLIFKIIISFKILKLWWNPENIQIYSFLNETISNSKMDFKIILFSNKDSNAMKTVE